MKRKKICTYLILIMLVVIIGSICYYQFFMKNKNDKLEGGTLVYERHVVYPDRQEC